MRFPRSGGILLHPTSLPGPFGVGDLGFEAFRFLDYLRSAGLKLWQVLPLNPTGYGDSPYQAFSAFAGNPLLISLEKLADTGVLERSDLSKPPVFPEGQVDFATLIPYKFRLLRKAATRFFSIASESERAEFETFCALHRNWLDDYALFIAAKDAHGGVVWTDWEPALATRQAEALEMWRRELAGEIATQKYWQFEFFRQWHALRSYANLHGIRIMGDIPIYVAHDSADVWVNRELFWLDERGLPKKISGVPPDYFSATGQLWGNPIYRWDLLEQTGFQWWIDRFRGCLEMFDIVRVDHFRGFEAYWEIPAGEQTAEKGHWVKAPGDRLFEKLTRVLGDLPLVAENLGVITPEVEAVRNRFGYPGMAILQFAFSTDPQAPSFRPHNYVHHQVAYTGGHDNDTMFGWWRSGVTDSTRSEADVVKEYADALAYFGRSKEEFDCEVNWIFIRQVMMSVADTVLFPMQDVLGLGSEARMNVPGTVGRNWRWRMRADALRAEDAARLRTYAQMYDR